MLGLDGWTQPQLQWECLSDITTKGVFTVTREKHALLRFLFQVKNLNTTNLSNKNLFIFLISAINVCAVQWLPLVRQTSYWLRAQMISVPEALYQAFFDYTILCTCKINASYIILLHTVRVADFWPMYRDWTWKVWSSHAKWSSFFLGAAWAHQENNHFNYSKEHIKTGVLPYLQRSRGIFT